MNRSFQSLLIRWLFLALGVVVATRIVKGISYDTVGTLVVVVLLLSFLNAVLRPLLLLISLPFILLTAGLGVIVVNALLFSFVGYLVEGFTVASFWSALGGSLVVSFTNFLLSAFLGNPARNSTKPPPPPKKQPPGKGDVIDI